MTNEITVQVAKLSPQPGDVLVFRYPAGMDREHACNLWQTVNSLTNYFGCKAVTVPDTLTVETLVATMDEAAMNAAGWVRRERVAALWKEGHAPAVFDGDYPPLSADRNPLFVFDEAVSPEQLQKLSGLFDDADTPLNVTTATPDDRQGPFNLLDGIRIDEENGKITQLRPGDVAVHDAAQPDVNITTTPPDERNPTP